MPENQEGSVASFARQARERLNEELRATGEVIRKLEQILEGLRGRQKQIGEAVEKQPGSLEKFEPPVQLDKLLSSVRNLITATLPEQVFDTLTEEGEQMGVRAAVFDVRGKAAWGASARGFGSGLSDKAFKALVVPLNKDNPFRQVYDIGGHVDVTAEQLKKARNVFDKFNPSADEPALLLPIRSAGSVAAIFYCDPGGKCKTLPVDALKIITEFAGAQLDRLMALSGGMPAAAEGAKYVGPGGAEGAVEFEEAAPQEQPSSRASSFGASAAPAVETPPAVERGAARPAAAATPAVAIDLSTLSEADQKIHKDAKRFAKLLVSEIDLYNKGKVSDGRKNNDIYKRLRADIDRSRQTYEKRFGKTLAKQYDYFHEEVVKTLAGNEPSLLGADYPGPSS